MKKMLFVSALAVALLMFAIPIVSAGMDFDDPALCVNGTWLLVDAAQPSAIKVVVPDDAKYGDQKAGKCKTPSPAPHLITNVKEGPVDHLMTVWVDGSKASTPTITASYGKEVQTRKNNGKLVVFVFFVR
ncbi:MAG: hypothetical protein HZB51_04900 [Chloroflexi bacterium]|nr:hypothetical protein [Chloroflexota bacterium]